MRCEMTMPELIAFVVIAGVLPIVIGGIIGFILFLLHNALLK